ncbi:hypothetical protein EDD92_8442 [Streptomyces sp. TLI_185]|nr:hypothetical protein EDD92_8442 [Streptomyces sp. TLI_185]
MTAIVVSSNMLSGRRKWVSLVTDGLATPAPTDKTRSARTRFTHPTVSRPIPRAISAATLAASSAT